MYTTFLQIVVSDNFDIAVVISIIFLKITFLYRRFPHCFFAIFFYKLSCIIPFDFAKPYPYFFFCNYSYKFLTHRHAGSMFLQIVIKNHYFLSFHILHQNLCVQMVFYYSLFFCEASYMIIYLPAYCT